MLSRRVLAIQQLPIHPPSTSTRRPFFQQAGYSTRPDAKSSSQSSGTHSQPPKTSHLQNVPSKPDKEANPSPLFRRIHKLIGQVLPYWVPRAPRKLQYAGKPMGPAAWRRLNNRTRRRWAKKTNRARRRLRAKIEEMRANPPFQVSKLLLDLDSINCPGVRPYTEEDERMLTEQWRSTPSMDALYQRMCALKKEIEQAKFRWNAPLFPHDTRRVTERDVLAVALLGVPAPVKTAGDETAALQEPPLGYFDSQAAWSIGLPPRITEDIHHTTHMLLHRLRIQPKLEAEKMDTPNGLRRSLDRVFRVEDKLETIQRLVAPLLQQPWGRQLVHGYRDVIVGLCAGGLEKESRQQAWRAYWFLQNISAALEADGLGLELEGYAQIRRVRERLTREELALEMGDKR